MPEGCSLAVKQSLSNACPSSEWESIREFFALYSHELPVNYQGVYRAAQPPAYFFFSGKESQRQYYSAHLEGVDPHVSPSYGTTQMVATADALTTTSALWFQGLQNVTRRSGHGSPLSDQTGSTHALDGDNYQAMIAGNCLTEAILNTTDTNPIAFPFLEDANNPTTPTINITSSDNYLNPAIVHPSLSRADVFTNASHPFEYQLQWVDLPQPLFNGSSVGAIIVPPQATNSTSDESRPQNLTICNLAAGWGTTILQTQQIDYMNDGGVSSQVSKFPGGSLFSFEEEPVAETAVAQVTFYYPGYPQLLINITQEWAQYLNPRAESANRSVFDLLMQEHFLVQGSQSIDAFNVSAADTLVLMITNGLARIGYESTLQGSPRSIPGTSFIDGNYWLSGKGNVFNVDPVESKD